MQSFDFGELFCSWSKNKQLCKERFNPIVSFGLKSMKCPRNNAISLDKAKFTPTLWSRVKEVSKEQCYFTDETKFTLVILVNFSVPK